MKTLAAVLFFAVLLLAAPSAASGATEFYPVEVYVDSGEHSLAAFQFEFLFDGEAVAIVGIEGGEGPFGDAPYYDPAGMKKGRIVIASFTTKTRPPRGRVLVAVLHLMQESQQRWEPEARLMVTAGPEGGRFEASIDIAGGQGGDHE